MTEIRFKAFDYSPIKKLFLSSTLKILKLGSFVDEFYLFSSELQSLDFDMDNLVKNLYVLPQFYDSYLAQYSAEGMSKRGFVIHPMPTNICIIITMIDKKLKNYGNNGFRLKNFKRFNRTS